MRKSLAVLVLGLSAAAYPQDSAKPEIVPLAKDVAQHIANKGLPSEYNKDIYWYFTSQEDNDRFFVYSGAYDFKKVKLYLCESQGLMNEEVLSICITDKGLDNLPGSCHVGRIPEENSFHHVLRRQFDPEYALGYLVERPMKKDDEAKQFCKSAYDRIKREIVK